MIGTAIRTCGLSYETGERILVDSVDLTVSTGEIVALCGPNGAGKTTLLRLLAGDLEPTRGEVSLNGKPLQAYSTAELAITRAVLPQETSLRFPFTVGEIVAMGRAPRRRARPGEDADAIARALEETDTASLATRTWPTLSGGERARVTLARVLAQDTPILLLDEPTAALDLHHQHLALSTARKLAGAQRTIVAVLHDLNLAARLADRIGLLKDGRLHTCAPAWDALTPDRLQAVFDTAVHIAANPLTSRPLVIPIYEDQIAVCTSPPTTDAHPAHAQSHPEEDT